MWIVSDIASHGQAAGTGSPTTSTIGTATTQPIAWISAVSSDLSVPDLISAFHEACNSAPNSTMTTIGQVRITKRSPVFGCQRGQLRMPDPRLRQRPRRLQDRIGDRADVRVDALQVADQVQVQRARLDAL